MPVLLYHSISRSPGDAWACRPEDFAADMAAVAASGRTPLTATAYARGLRGEQPLPESPVLVTFDDGYADFTEYALPALETHGLTGTLFVTSGWLGTARMLSAGALRDLAAHGGAEIGAHSVHHPHLDIVGGARAEAEIRESGERLADLLGRPVTAFAYPHGSHRASTRRMVRQSGYTTAYAVSNALSHAADDPYAIARFTVHAGTSRAQVARFLAGDARRARPRERPATSLYREVRRVRQWLGGTR